MRSSHEKACDIVASPAPSQLRLSPASSMSTPGASPLCSGNPDPATTSATLVPWLSVATSPAETRSQLRSSHEMRPTTLSFNPQGWLMPLSAMPTVTPEPFATIPPGPRRSAVALTVTRIVPIVGCDRAPPPSSTRYTRSCSDISWMISAEADAVTKGRYAAAAISRAPARASASATSALFSAETSLPLPSYLATTTAISR